MTLLPYYTEGEVVSGFQRGSTDLGMPTANFKEEVVENLPAEFQLGVYYGWALLEDHTNPMKMVMSVGYNPTYNNTKRVMETHILHKFDKPFYGKNLKICVTNYLRPEITFKGLDELIVAIKEDIVKAEAGLTTPGVDMFSDEHFKK